MDNSTLIDEVKAFRAKYGVSASHLARIVKLTPQGWAKKEAGKAPFYGHELARIARRYNVPLREAFPSYQPTEEERILAEELRGAA